MNSYTNSFRAVSCKEKNEVIIEFRQNVPCFDENEQIIGEQNEVVSSVVMSRATAEKLLAAVQAILSNN